MYSWKEKPKQFNRQRVRVFNRIHWLNDQEFFDEFGMIFNVVNYNKRYSQDLSGFKPNTSFYSGYYVAKEDTNIFIVYQNRKEVLYRIILPSSNMQFICEREGYGECFLSPDNKELAFFLFEEKSNRKHICLANSDGNNVRLIKFNPPPNRTTTKQDFPRRGSFFG